MTERLKSKNVISKKTKDSGSGKSGPALVPRKLALLLEEAGIKGPADFFDFNNDESVDQAVLVKASRLAGTQFRSIMDKNPFIDLLPAETQSTLISDVEEIFAGIPSLGESLNELSFSKSRRLPVGTTMFLRGVIADPLVAPMIAIYIAKNGRLRRKAPPKPKFKLKIDGTFSFDGQKWVKSETSIHIEIELDTPLGKMTLTGDGTYNPVTGESTFTWNIEFGK